MASVNSSRTHERVTMNINFDDNFMEIWMIRRKKKAANVCFSTRLSDAVIVSANSDDGLYRVTRSVTR